MDTFYTDDIVFLYITIIQLIVLQLTSASSFNILGKIGELNYNSVVYIVMMLVSFFLYMIMCLLLKKKVGLNRINHRLYNFVYFLTFGFALHFLYRMYCNETSKMPFGSLLTDSFLREQVNHLMFTLFMSIAIVGLIYIILNCGKTIFGNVRIYFSVFFSLLGGVFSYAPNIFQYDKWELYHMDAYINSIVNVMFLIPYSDINSSIYGHYGLIYYPFVKLFGNDLNAIALTIALFTGITFLAAFYILQKLIKNDLLFLTSIIAVLSISFTFFGAGPYFQGMPHRCLFPILTLAFITWLNFNLKSNKIIYFLEFVFGVVAIVFNLETGVFCVGLLVLYNVLSKWEKTFKKNVLLFFKSSALIVVCVCAAYALVNFYNILLGGTWNSVKTFIYPFASEEYKVFSLLRLPLPPPDTPYFLYIVVFSYAAFSSSYNILFNNRRQCLDIEKFIIAISGLGSLLYFINRTAPGNLFISHFQMVILLAVFSDTFINMDKRIVYDEASGKTLNILASFIAFFLVGWFAIEGVISVGNAITYREKGVWETSALEQDLNAFEKWAPKGAVAFGMGISELYYELGLNTGIHITDWPDMNHFSLKRLDDNLSQCSEVVVSEYSIKLFNNISLLLKNNGYYEKERFVGKIIKCVHYKKLN